MPAPIHFSHKILRLMAQDEKVATSKGIVGPDSGPTIPFEVATFSILSH